MCLSGLAQLRGPLALLTALAVPLTRALGRALSAPAVALLGAMLLAVSPVLVLSGRTATLDGVSLPLALLAILALVHGTLAPPPRLAWRWGALLQAALASRILAYAPVRLL